MNLDKTTIHLKSGVTMKKMICRYVCMILTVLSLFGLTAPLNGIVCPAAQAAAKQTFASGDICTVAVRRLNVRSGPSTKNKVITKLKKGTEVTVEKTEKGWCYVKYAKGNGYVDGKYLKKKSADTGIVTFPDSSNTYTTTCTVRMRAKPSSKSRAMGKLEKGTSVNVLSTKGKWSEIIYHERHVWIASKYLKKVE